MGEGLGDGSKPGARTVHHVANDLKKIGQPRSPSFWTQRPFPEAVEAAAALFVTRVEPPGSPQSFFNFYGTSVIIRGILPASLVGGVGGDAL